MEALKEMGVMFGKSIVMALIGLTAFQIPSFEFLPEYLTSEPIASLATETVTFLFGLWFIWRSGVMLNERIKEKKIQNESNMYDLLKKQEEDKNEGLKAPINELIELLKKEKT